MRGRKNLVIQQYCPDTPSIYCLTAKAKLENYQGSTEERRGKLYKSVIMRCSNTVVMPTILL